MKHLKQFESFGENYYKEIPTIDFFRADGIEMEPQELEVITKIITKKGGWIDKHGLYMFTIHTPRLVGTVTYDIHTNLKKSDDEFYYVAYDIMNEKKFYQADQFDGLIKLLGDIL